MSVHDPNEALDALRASLAAKLPRRRFELSLKNPVDLPEEHVRQGVVCIVSEGGGDFANYMGREGQLGVMSVSLVGFVLVDEKDEPAEVQRAELQLVKELLEWTADPGDVRAGDSVLPDSYSQSKQLEHPYGWVVLKLDVRP